MQMQTHELVPHPAYPPASVGAVTARVIGYDANWLRLRWRIEGSGALIVPDFAGKGRADGLWQSTCFEAFLQPDGGEAYVELNLSPSERWAVYDFTAPRQGMADRPMPREPDSTMRRGSSFVIFDASIPAQGLPRADCALGLSAVIEEEGGVKSYWALAHGGETPDFHDPACFTAGLAAPPRK